MVSIRGNFFSFTRNLFQKVKSNLKGFLFFLTNSDDSIAWNYFRFLFLNISTVRDGAKIVKEVCSVLSLYRMKSRGIFRAGFEKNCVVRSSVSFTRAQTFIKISVGGILLYYSVRILLRATVYVYSFLCVRLVKKRYRYIGTRTHRRVRVPAIGFRCTFRTN